MTHAEHREDAVKHGFRVMDSDLHAMEPDGLWERYLDPRFRASASRAEVLDDPVVV